jgi:hypothetical protein
VNTQYRDLAGYSYETEWHLNPFIYEHHRYVTRREISLTWWSVRWRSSPAITISRREPSARVRLPIGMRDRTDLDAQLAMYELTTARRSASPLRWVRSRSSRWGWSSSYALLVARGTACKVRVAGSLLATWTVVVTPDILNTTYQRTLEYTHGRRTLRPHLHRRPACGGHT